MGLECIEGGNQSSSLKLSEFIEYATAFFAEHGETEILIDTGCCREDGVPVFYAIAEFGKHTDSKNDKFCIRLATYETPTQLKRIK